MGESKRLINSLYSYGVCCSYTEYRQFKKSAAQAAVGDSRLFGISSSDHGLVQGIVDNFDADISSQNGRQSTHSLAILMTQYAQNPDEKEEMTTHTNNQESPKRFPWCPIRSWHTEVSRTQAASNATPLCCKECSFPAIPCTTSDCC